VNRACSGPRHGHNGGVNHHGLHPAHKRPADLDLELLYLLRQDAQSVERLVEVLSHEAERVGPAAVRSRLEGLASRGLVRSSEGPRTGASDDEPPRADLWEVTDEGRVFVELRSGVARAPHDRDIGGEGGGRDTGFWVLVVIGFVTAVCAAYTLLSATGVLGG
jgi:hypothetical protein